MKKIERRTIDWVKTGKRLQMLREHDIDFIRYACFACHFNEGNCSGECENCGFDKDLDHKITREELAMIFSVTDAVVNNWETGRTAVPLEELYLYCDISNKTLEELVVFEK